MADWIVGTAGHIDHGKTALVRALTGMDTDRLPEEQARGISIDLGFAHFQTPDGTTFGVVDVPGHEAFVRTMIAGASGFDMVLLCVAADEGVMPQTREHLEIITLLGVPSLLVVLTRADRAEPGMAELVEAEVEELLEGTPFEGAPAIRVSSLTGEGIDALRDELVLLAGALRSTADPLDLPFLPVDRHFTIRGTGTVVTGTLRSGAIQVGDTLTLFPEGVAIRVRGVERHGAAVERAGPGSRVAVAMTARTGSLPPLQRGAALAGGEGWEASQRLTVRLDPLLGREEKLAPGTRLRLLLGTGEVRARVRRVKGSASVLLVTEEPVVARGGERIILRALSPVETVGGGSVIHPHPRGRFSASEGNALLDAFGTEEKESRLESILRSAGPRGVPTRELAVRSGLAPQALAEWSAGGGVREVAGQLFHPSVTSNQTEEWEAAVSTFHRDYPEEVGIPPEQLEDTGFTQAVRKRLMEELVAAERLVWRTGRLAHPGHIPRLPPDSQLLAERLEVAIRGGGGEGWEVAASDLGISSENRMRLLRFLERNGSVVEVAPGRWLDAVVERELLEALRAAVPVGTLFSPGDAREALGLSRKFLLPLFERWDSLGWTERKDEGRVVSSSAFE